MLQKKLENISMPKFGPQWKGWEIIYQVRQIIAVFCKLVLGLINLSYLILG